MLDKEYWKAFYRKHGGTNEPSAFCLFLLDALEQYAKPQNQLRILDAGCGDGRDSYAFATAGHNVCGVDSSEHIPSAARNVHFAVDDFTTHLKQGYDLIYARFSFHSISNEGQDCFLKSIQQPGTLLCMETRSDKGKDASRVYGDAHYRNFTNLDALKAQLKVHNFDTLFLYEGQDVAIYKHENPVCIRVIARKRG